MNRTFSKADTMCVDSSTKLQDACAAAEHLLSLPMKEQPDRLSLSLRRKSRSDDEKRLSYSDHVSAGSEKRISLNDRLRKSFRDLRIEDTSLHQEEKDWERRSLSISRSEATTATTASTSTAMAGSSINFKLRRSTSSLSTSSLHRPSALNSSTHSGTGLLDESGSHRLHESLSNLEDGKAGDASKRRISDLSASLSSSRRRRTSKMTDLDTSSSRRCSSRLSARLPPSLVGLSSSARGSTRSSLWSNNSIKLESKRRANSQVALSSKSLAVPPTEGKDEGNKNAEWTPTKTTRRPSNHKVDVNMAVMLDVANRASQLEAELRKRCKSVSGDSTNSLLGLTSEEDSLDGSMNSLLDEEEAPKQAPAPKQQRISRKDRIMAADLPELVTAPMDTSIRDRNVIRTRSSNGNITNHAGQSRRLPTHSKSAGDLSRMTQIEQRSTPSVERTLSDMNNFMHKNSSSSLSRLLRSKTTEGITRSQRTSRRDRLKSSSPKQRRSDTSDSSQLSSNVKTLSRSTTLPVNNLSRSTGDLRMLINSAQQAETNSTLSSKSSLSDLNNLLKRTKPTRKNSNINLRRLLRANSGQATLRRRERNGKLPPPKCSTSSMDLTNTSLVKARKSSTKLSTLPRSTTLPTNNKSAGDLRKLMNAQREAQATATLSGKSSLSDLNNLLKRNKPTRKNSNSDLKRLLRSNTTLQEGSTRASRKLQEARKQSSSDTSITDTMIARKRGSILKGSNESQLGRIHLSSAVYSSSMDEVNIQNAQWPRTVKGKQSSITNKLDLLNASMTSMMNESNSTLLNESFQRPSNIGRKGSQQNISSLLAGSAPMKKKDEKKPTRVRSLEQDDVKPQLASKAPTRTLSGEKIRGITRNPSLGNKLELLASMNRSKSTAATMGALTTQDMSRKNSLHQKLEHLALLDAPPKQRAAAASCVNLRNCLPPHKPSLMSVNMLKSQGLGGTTSVSNMSLQKNAQWSTSMPSASRPNPLRSKVNPSPSKPNPFLAKVDASSPAANIIKKSNPFTTIVNSTLTDTPGKVFVSALKSNPFSSIVQGSLADSSANELGNTTW